MLLLDFICNGGLTGVVCLLQLSSVDFVTYKQDISARLQRAAMPGILTATINVVNADVAVSSIWCPPTGCSVSVDGSRASVYSHQAFNDVMPMDYDSPYRGSSPCPADVIGFLEKMQRLEELGGCTFPRVIVNNTDMLLTAQSAAFGPMSSHEESVVKLLSDSVAALRAGQLDSARALATAAIEATKSSDQLIFHAQALACAALTYLWSDDIPKAQQLFQAATEAALTGHHSSLACKVGLGLLWCACVSDLSQLVVQDVALRVASAMSDHRAIASIAATCHAWRLMCPTMDMLARQHAVFILADGLFNCSDQFSRPLAPGTVCYPTMSFISVLRVHARCGDVAVALRDYPVPLASVRGCVASGSVMLAQVSAEEPFIKV